jgi:hypothetical protein
MPETNPAHDHRTHIKPLGGEAIREPAGEPATPEDFSSLVNRVCHKGVLFNGVGDGIKSPTLMGINVHSFTSGVEMDGSCQRARWHSQLSSLAVTTHRHNGCPRTQTSVISVGAHPRGPRAGGARPWLLAWRWIVQLQLLTKLVSSIEEPPRPSGGQPTVGPTVEASHTQVDE